MPEEVPVMDIYWLIALLVLLLVPLVTVSLVVFFRDFTRQLAYLNSEIERSEGRQRRHWIRRRRRLWLSLLPFIKY